MSPPRAAPQPASNVHGEQCHWFAKEVHPHGAQLKSYLHRAFPSVRDVDDVVQESYLRIWKARAEQPIRSAKGFLFEVARRLAIDFTRHQARSPVDVIPDFGALAVIEDRPGTAEAVSTRLQRSERGDVSLFLRRVHASRREGYFHFDSSFLRGLFAGLLGLGLGLLLFLGRRGRGGLGGLLRLLLFRRGLGRGRSGALDQLHQRHRRVVTGTRRHVQDAGVATRARLEARADGVEQLGDDLGVAQAREGETAVGFAVFLAEGDQRLDDAAQFLGLRHRGADGLVTQQRDRKAAEQRMAVRRIARQLATGKVMTHFLSSWIGGAGLSTGSSFNFRSFRGRHRA